MNSKNGFWLRGCAAFRDVAVEVFFVGHSCKEKRYGAASRKICLAGEQRFSREANYKVRSHLLLAINHPFY